MLVERTRRFAVLPRGVDEILEFGRQVQASQLRNQPLADFHHCPFIGLIGESHQRVGCLLHPLADGNKGIDYRGLSYYGAMACRQYFCPSHRELPTEIKKTVQRLAENWYDYGLVITEVSLLSAMAEEMEKRLASPLLSMSACSGPAALRALREVVFLKLGWPYRKDGGRDLCHYFFSDRKHERQPVDFTAAGRPAAAFGTILTELTSAFGSAAELLSAERRLENLFQRAADLLGGGEQ